MKNIEFRAWNKKEECYEGINDSVKYDIVLTLPSCKVMYLEEWDVFGGGGLDYTDVTNKYEIEMYSGIKSTGNTGEKIYAGDIVRIAGYGNYLAEFPFFELYDCLLSGNSEDIGDIVGHVRTNPELLEDK